MKKNVSKPGVCANLDAPKDRTLRRQKPEDPLSIKQETQASFSHGASLLIIIALAKISYLVGVSPVHEAILIAVEVSFVFRYHITPVINIILLMIGRLR